MNSMSHVWQKKTQLLETIPKTRKSTKKKSEKKEYDLAKWTVKFLRHLDYACLRDFDVKIFVGYEISPTCFCVIKRGLIRKPNKSEMTTELKSVIKNIPTHLRPTDHHRIVIIGLMAYARNVPIKKQNLKTYNDFFYQSLEHVQLSFQVMQSCGYCFWCVQSEQRRRMTVEGIETIISGFIQPLLVEIDRFLYSNFTRGNWSILVCIKE